MLTGLTEDVTGDNGERIELDCLVDSNPGPAITWTRPGHSQVNIWTTLVTKIFGRVDQNYIILSSLAPCETKFLLFAKLLEPLNIITGFNI